MRFCARWRIALILLLASAAHAGQKKVQRESLTNYLNRLTPQPPDLKPATPGSLWIDNGQMARLSADYKASRVGDVITIVVAQGTTANNAGSVSTARTFNASSSVAALAGHISTSGVQNIFSPSSSETLAGKSSASTTSTLTTTLAGQVVAVLPNGTLVVEAERQLLMNNERQTILLRGLVRPGDIAPDGTVPSNSIGDLQLELKGKGVLSDGTRPPNVVMRILQRIVGF